VTAPEAGLAKPARELKAFAKTRELKPGESQTLKMVVDNYGIASFNDANSAWEAPAGTYKVCFGASVEDIRATADYKLKKAQSWPVNDLFELNVPLNEITVTRK
jgi:beta-glucosidase